EVRDIEWPTLRFAPVNSMLITVEAFAYHEADLRATPEKFAPQLRNRMRSGGLYLSSEYVQAQRARRLMCDEATALLREVDLIALPSSPRTAPTFAEAYALPGARRPTGFTGPFNMTGLPALSLCCGFDACGLPIGLQLAGRPFDEATVLRAGHAYERAAGWHSRHPAL